MMHAMKPRARTALELHARFFDPDHDERVTPRQAFRGMVELGLPSLLAAPLALLISVFLGYLTQRRLSLAISVPHVARGKHPFATGVFGPSGAFDERTFAQLFVGPHIHAPRDRITYPELRALLLKNGDPRRPFGWVGSLLSRAFSAAEVYTLFCLAADCQKLVGDRVLPAMSRKNLLRFYEGRLFVLLSRRRRMRSAGALP